eukprot:TRINITY_DN27121_c0_g1_i1.p2 TRINITY_DN27121_c0_g1~~TRINITY_DN27121_c0_g1_i1.p2  ORF type:complete len:121 (+),score=45.47 TRINITY_DN27121_c0_g1_i1:210-572(+)
MVKPMKKVKSNHKMPKNLQVYVVPKTEGKDSAAELRDAVAHDSPAAVGWLKDHLFGGRILRVPVSAQRAKKKVDKKAVPTFPFYVPQPAGKKAAASYDPTVKVRSEKSRKKKAFSAKQRK